MAGKLSTMMEDFSLESVPADMRKPWKELASFQVGIVTSLAVIMTGGLITFMAGFWMGMLASVLAFLISLFFSFLLGKIAFKEGYSSNVISRAYAFGSRGSVISSIIMAFMIIGFLGMESVFIGNSILFYFNIEANLTIKIIMYLVMSSIWILLSLFGMKMVARVAQITLPFLFLFLIYMIYQLIGNGSIGEVFTHGIMVPGVSLGGGFAIALNATITLAGLNALVCTDSTRFARSTKDVAKVCLSAGMFMFIITTLIGAVITYFGYQTTYNYYLEQGYNAAAASNLAITNPGVTLTLAGGMIGVLIILLSQAKVQVGNSYEGALSLVNLFDSGFNWKPGRPIMVVLTNIISLIFIFGDILHYIEEFLSLGSVLFGVWVTIVLTDYYIYRGVMGKAKRGIENLEQLPAFNLSGIITLVLSTIIGMVVYQLGWFPIPFVVSVIIAFLLYTTLCYFKKSIVVEEKQIVSQ
ncbi:cytosine permease [Bacillus sp. EB106-08-02-XG196]|jgi:cytosine permease|uniref:purine-cytosine permease family protein n=1 Tax=Bacillus sp. EB106-08-02-XG196 TaxID=2737049 RepID=UPI0015C4260A|nr:cytosine permease [Bacillus sp. EB106-08-02-XG196]NWQ43977.1 cytosine permease [Bacillus sp. EB106-08-02-XG196]